MKNVLIVLAVIAMASPANAVLRLVVDDSALPDIVFKVPGEVRIINIYGDGLVSSGQEFYLQITGGVALDITNVNPIFNPAGVGALDLGEGLYFLDLAKPVLPIPPLPDAVVMDGIALHYPGIEEIGTVTLLDGTFTPHDILTVHNEVPEPITLAVMGVGGLFLRRRK